MKYAVAAFVAAFVFAIVPQADARQKPYAKLTLQEKFERDLQCSAKANEAKLTLDKRADYIKKCQG